MTCERFIAAAISALCISAAQAQAGTPTTDWATFGRFLSLLQVVAQAAAASCPPGAAAQGCDPNAAQQVIDNILDGKNSDANHLMLEILADVPPPEREKLLSLGRSMAVMARKQTAAQADLANDAQAIRARKDLAGMGLAYHDAGQFIDAVKRNDLIAVRLFLTSRGVDPNAKDVWGNSALDLARRGGNRD